MIKSVLLIFIALFGFSYCYAQTGCLTGDYIYITANGTYNDGGAILIKYNSTDRIAKRNYAEDPVLIEALPTVIPSYPELLQIPIPNVYQMLI